MVGHLKEMEDVIRRDNNRDDIRNKSRDNKLENKGYGHGRFGKFGGRFAPETLMNALIELENAYLKY